MSSPSADTATGPGGPNASPNVGAAVTFATTEHFNLQTARAILLAGAIVGAAALSIQRRHQCQARDAFSPEAVDRASIVVPSPSPTQPLEA